MELRYHSCGHPVRVWAACRRQDDSPTFFDGGTSWNDRAIRSCPRCGQHLTLTALHEQPHVADETIRSWQRAWPPVRQQLREQLARSQDTDPAMQARAVLTLVAFDQALASLAALAEQAALHAPAEAHDELLLPV